LPASAVLNLRVGVAAPYPDQQLTLAMVNDPGIVTGSTRWRDPGATGAEPPSYPIANVQIAASNVIVGYDPNSADHPDANAAPRRSRPTPSGSRTAREIGPPTSAIVKRSASPRTCSPPRRSCRPRRTCPPVATIGRPPTRLQQLRRSSTTAAPRPRSICCQG